MVKPTKVIAAAISASFALEGPRGASTGGGVTAPGYDDRVPTCERIVGIDAPVRRGAGVDPPNVPCRGRHRSRPAPTPPSEATPLTIGSGAESPSIGPLGCTIPSSDSAALIGNSSRR